MILDIKEVLSALLDRKKVSGESWNTGEYIRLKSDSVGDHFIMDEKDEPISSPILISMLKDANFELYASPSDKCDISISFTEEELETLLFALPPAILGNKEEVAVYRKIKKARDSND